MYFAAKDGGPMGGIIEMVYMGGCAVKTADNTIAPIGLFLMSNMQTPEVVQSIRAAAFVLADFTSYEGADISNPETLKSIMFQFNGVEGMPEIIEITKEEFYSLD